MGVWLSLVLCRLLLMKWEVTPADRREEGESIDPSIAHERGGGEGSVGVGVGGRVKGMVMEVQTSVNLTR